MQIVLKGYNFENEPEGGLILIDEIEYFAELDPPESCAPKEIDGSDIEPFPKRRIDDETNIREAQVVSGDTPG